MIGSLRRLDACALFRPRHSSPSSAGRHPPRISMVVAALPRWREAAPARSESTRAGRSGRHFGAAVPALVERSVDAFAAAAAHPVPPRRTPQLGEHPARLVVALVIGDPQFGQRLVGWDLAGDAADVGALHRDLEAGAAQHVGPQRGERQVGRARDPDHDRRTASDDTTMPPPMSATASAWKARGHSPSIAPDSSAANSGVRFETKVATAGPAAATPSPHNRYATSEGPIATNTSASASPADQRSGTGRTTPSPTAAPSVAHPSPRTICTVRNSAQSQRGR